MRRRTQGTRKPNLEVEKILGERVWKLKISILSLLYYYVKKMAPVVMAANPYYTQPNDLDQTSIQPEAPNLNTWPTLK